MVVRLPRDHPGDGAGLCRKNDMHLNHAGLDEEISLDLELYDSRTNTNLRAELYGPAAEIEGVLRRTAGLMLDAGFVPGWRPKGWNGGTIDYPTLVRLALERCRRAPGMS
jgi:hypothetical protein